MSHTFRFCRNCRISTPLYFLLPYMNKCIKTVLKEMFDCHAIFTARIRRMGGRYCFQFVCQSTSQGGRGVPQSGLGGGYSIPGLAGGGVPHPRSGLGVGGPHPRSGWGVPGVPPNQVRMGYPLDLGWGTPLDMGQGTPLDLGWGTPSPRHGQGTPWTWDRVPPRPGTGYPPDLGRGTPPDLGRGTPQTWDRVPPPTDLGWGTPPPGIASTCYAAGGMPLAFTQEDLLVV